MFQVLSYSVPEVVCLIYFFYVLMIVDCNQYFSFTVDTIMALLARKNVVFEFFSTVI